jgi:hypothetical protein
MKKSKKRLLIETALSEVKEDIILYSKSWIVTGISEDYSTGCGNFIYHIKCFKTVYSFSTIDGGCRHCSMAVPDNILVTYKMLVGE